MISSRFKRKFHLLILPILLIVTLSGCSSYNPKESGLEAVSDSLPEMVDFNLHVKPILSDKCFICHGPDNNKRKADLRLDTKEGAIAALGEHKDRYAIVPGDAEESEVYKRLITTNKAEIMPLPESNLSLSSYEIAVIKKWIEQGAEYKPHWSFISVKKPEVPQVENKKWPVNSIDNFILSRLEKEKLRPSPEANKETLIRRVSLDLTGLPPTIQEIDAFLADKSSKAYEKLVDKLLASPAYGEKMAGEWMDVARYADSHGYQDDGYRNTWLWRDWVIKAFNENMPYDKFATWQLAGDLLPNATREQKLATCFNRNHAQSQEGGIVEEEYRVEYVLDRTNTSAKAFLGLTMECSRCHDHKYDPISQKDYYSFSAFFNQNEEAGQIPDYGVPGPSIVLTSKEAEDKLKFINENILSKQKELNIIATENTGSFEKWYNQNRGKIKNVDLTKGLIAYFPLDAAVEGPAPKDPAPRKLRSTKNQSDELISGKPLDKKPMPKDGKKKPAKPVQKPQEKKVQVEKEYYSPNPSDKFYPGMITGNPTFVEGKKGKAFSFDGENNLAAYNVGDFERSEPFSLSLWVYPTRDTDEMPLLSRILWETQAAAGYDLYISKNKISARIINTWPSNALQVTSKNSFKVNAWNHIAMTYDGSSKAAGLKIFINGEGSPLEINKDRLFKSIRRGMPWPMEIGTSHSFPAFIDGKMDEVKVYNRELTKLEVEELADKSISSNIFKKSFEQLTDQEKNKLYVYYLSYADKNYQNTVSEITKLRLEENDVITPVEQVMVMEDMKKSRPTFVLMRGAYDAHGEMVEPNAPAFLGGMPKNYPKNRLGLAKWLTDPKNPLMSRVTVNRYWQQYFGTGLVKSSDDFGNQGSLPSHPEFLDWLSTTFVESGWDVKAFQKMIVMSATYRQSSKITKELMAKDPQNILFTRGPRYRLPFEIVRDNVLTASNLLTKKIGGPSVRPYQPEGVWEEKTSGRYLTYYEQDHGENLYRRSLYTFFKRTAPPPAQMTFDGSERNTCYVKRQSTNTPLQALVTLNDPQFLEAARVLAERMMKEGGSKLEERISFAYRASLARFPSKKEIEILSRLYQKEIERFNSDKNSATGFLKVGEKPVDPKLNSAELAANAVLATTILNLDEVITKQ